MSFKFLMISKKKIYFDDYIKYIKLSSYKGELEIYSQHSPIVFIVKNTFININIKFKKSIYFYICKGFLEFKFNKLIILIEKLLKLNTLKKKIYLKKKEKILKKIKNNYFNENINKFLKLDLKLKKYNDIISFIRKNRILL